jgi:hypothetical protein
MSRRHGVKGLDLAAGEPGGVLGAYALTEGLRCQPKYAEVSYPAEEAAGPRGTANVGG